MTQASDLRAARRFLTWRTSSAVRTKETATVSTPLSDGEDEVFFVLFGERGDVDGDAGQVDSLVFTEHSAVDDLADDVETFDGLDAEFDEAVGEQDAGAGLEVFSERLEGGTDKSGVAFNLARSDGEELAGDELDGLVAFQLAGADLGALQIGEGCRWACAPPWRLFGPCG